MEIYNIRNVAQREIYDSYMGILRISPVEDDDDITHILQDVNTSTTIYLSDSDGNVLGSGIFGDFSFVPKVKRFEDGDLILIQTKADYVYVSDELNVRSTLIIGSKTEDVDDARKSKLKFYFSADDVTTFYTNGVLIYPVESPNDEDYFNNKFKIGTPIEGVSFDFSDFSYIGEERKEKLEENLRKLSPSDFDALIEENKIKPSDLITIKNQKVYYPNEKNEAIPALRTRDYVLGHCSGHSGIITTGTTENFLEKNEEYNTIEPGTSKFTKLSYLDIDKMVWDCLEDIMLGKIRMFEGRYRELGLKKEDSIFQKLFGEEGAFNASLYEGKNSDLFNTAPFIVDEVQKGVIIYNAVPLRRYLFHTLKQIARNEIDLNQKEENDNDKVKPFKRFSSNPMNNLTKNYLLCNNKEINFDNYQNINILNNSLFEIEENSFKVKIENGKPKMKSISSGNISDGVYGAIKGSSKNKTFKTPDIFRLSENSDGVTYSPRFLRGLTWNVSDNRSFDGFDGVSYDENKRRKDGFDNDILDMEETIKINEKSSYPNDSNYVCNNTCYFRKDDGSFYSIKELQAQTAFKDYFLHNDISLEEIESYGKNVDFYINSSSHYHYSFYKYNGVVTEGGNVEKISQKTAVKIVSPFKRRLFGQSINTTNTNKIVYGINFARPIAYYFINDFFKHEEYQSYCFKEGVENIKGHKAVRIAGKTIFNIKNPPKITSFYFPNGSNDRKGVTYTLEDYVSEDPTNDTLGSKIQQLVYKLNDVEGRYPISWYGGNNVHQIRGYYHCRVHGSVGENHPRTYYYYRKGMVYKIHGTETKPSEYYCITSLPIKSVYTLGNRGLVERNNFKTDDNGNYFNISSENEVSPSHYNLLPLIRI